MDRLIRDLLDTATIDAGRLSIEVLPVRLQQLVADSIETLAPLASGKSIRLKSELSEDLPAVAGDPDRLEQVLANLIGNALKFRSASVPRVHVFVAQQDAAWHFMVRDNGIGIEPQYFERIFMVFQRLHNKAEYPGTGIGLAICKKVVERHGGRIWVESRPGEGSAFYFTLPKIPGERA